MDTRDKFELALTNANEVGNLLFQFDARTFKSSFMTIKRGDMNLTYFNLRHPKAQFNLK